MKYSPRLNIVIFALLFGILFIFSDKLIDDKIQSISQSSPPIDVGNISDRISEQDSSPKIVIKGNNGKASQEKRPFILRVISEEWIDLNESKTGRRRVRVVESNFKYPLLRLEERVWTNPETGEVSVQQTGASVADHLMVGIKEGGKEQEVATALRAAGFRIRAIEPESYLLAELPDFDRVENQKEGVIAIEALDEFIDFAEPDYLVYPSIEPNDPAFVNRELWGLNNLGGVSGSLLDADVDAPEGWEIENDASSVIVAVTDSGIRYDHEDLIENMWVDSSGSYGFDAYDDDFDPLDTDGHGTHCAGTIGAKGNNGKGITGVAWNVQLMALRFLGENGGTTSDAVRVVNYARLQNASVINASWGGGNFSQSLYNAILACYQNNIVFVAAAGNDSLDTDSNSNYPSSYDR